MSSIDSIEAREKHKRDRYREAARRLYPTVKISPHADVHEDAEKSGAFLPASVWVPADALDKE